MNKSQKKKLNKNVLKFSEHIFEDMLFINRLFPFFKCQEKTKMSVCVLKPLQK